jgi:chromosome segregation ATPase
VNISASPKKIIHTSLDKFIPLLAAKGSSSCFFLFFLPFGLLFLNCGVSLLKPTVITPFFPYIALSASAICMRFRFKGLIAIYIGLAIFIFCFFAALLPQERLWHMGNFCALALSLYILGLALDEAENALCLLEAENNHSLDTLRQLQDSFSMAKKASEEEVRELSDEISRLKEEAEQRRIERISELKKIELIESEILWLTEQKNAFIEEAREARTEAHVQVEQTERLQESCRAEMAVLQSKVQQLLEEKSSAERQKAQIEDKMLLGEESKSALEHNLRQCETALQQARIYSENLSKEKNALLSDLAEIKNEYIANQNILMEWQQRAPVIIEKVVEKKVANEKFEEENARLKKILSQNEGLYTQLRSQFEEKTEVLAQARQELFAAQSKLFTFEKEKANQACHLGEEETKALEAEIEYLSEEMESLQNEISHLEALISRILFP